MMYQVETKVLNQSVKRNIKRFPTDFMFQLDSSEWEILMSQIATSSWGGKRKLPYAFTEQGIAMLSGLLNSDIAIEINIRIMRVFVAVRNLTLGYTKNKGNKSLEERFKSLEDANEELLKDINDLSEDTRNNLDDIYIALAELADKQKKVTEGVNTPRKPIGYQHYYQ
jgi:hypothetical protein